MGRPLWEVKGQVERYALRSDDPVPGSNEHVADLCFEGRLLIEVEDVWNDAETLGTYLDGEIVNRLAVYERAMASRAFRRPQQGVRFVAEQARYNPRAILNPPRGARRAPIPFFSKAVESESFEHAVAWIEAGELIAEGQLRQKFADEVQRCRAAPVRPRLDLKTWFEW